jgi:hypothetical protein
VVAILYLALGGASYKPTPVADPCVTRDWRNPGGTDEVLEQVLLSALDGAACRLHVSREDLVLAFKDEGSLREFADQHNVSLADAARAFRDGLTRAAHDAQAAGALPSSTAELLRSVLGRLPTDLALDLFRQLRGLVG